MGLLDINGRTDTKSPKKVVLKPFVAARRCTGCRRQMHGFEFRYANLNSDPYCSEACWVKNTKRGE